MSKPAEDRTALAGRVARHMVARGAFFAHLRMGIIDMRPGYALARLLVREDFLNSHGNCHGGVIFSLADSVFGFASNSYNQIAVGANCDIAYLAPALLGDELTAEANEIYREGRTALYDVTVIDQRGNKIALMRARSRSLDGKVLPD
jgi:acyl-CoA thioesterase